MINMSEIARRLGNDCPADIRVLVYVMEHIDENSLFWGTAASIAKELRLSKSSVDRAITWMKEKRVVEIVQPGVWRVLVKPRGFVDTYKYVPSEIDDDQYVVIQDKRN